MTADFTGQEFLAFCEREKRGDVIVHDLRNVTGRNGVWRVQYEEVKKIVDTKAEDDKVKATG